jgi:hypothetical protein
MARATGDQRLLSGFVAAFKVSLKITNLRAARASVRELELRKESNEGGVRIASGYWRLYAYGSE